MTEVYFVRLSEVADDLWGELVNELSEERREYSLRSLYREESVAEEHFRADTLPQHIRQSVLAGWLLERGLQNRDIAPPFHYGKTKHGKPILLSETMEAAPHFSLSHSGDYAYAAISDQPVGIDVEDMARREKKGSFERIAKRFFSKEEQRELAESGDTDDAKVQTFFRLWTAKEATSKALDMPLPHLLNVTVWEKYAENLTTWQNGSAIVTVWKADAAECSVHKPEDYFFFRNSRGETPYISRNLR